MPELTRRSANEIYESGLDSMLSGADHGPYYAVGDDGSRRRLPLKRWLDEAHGDEEVLLDRAVGPVLDIGCGVGRHLVSLGRRGIEATGVELSGYAVGVARGRQAAVIHGSVFDVIEPRGWKTTLLLDGNIGIGGEPQRLLAKVAELLAPGGQVLVELEPPGTESRTQEIRLEGPGDLSDWFPWAWVSCDGIGPIAEEVGLKTVETWSAGRRWFAQLLRQPAS